MVRPASQTAVGPICIVAVEQQQPVARRLLQDDLAYHMLPTSVRFVVRLTRWQVFRDMLIAATEKTRQGLWSSMLCRKRYIDDITHDAIRSIDALVILGAGLDTLAYRIPELAARAVFELDLPENIAAKRRALLKLYGKIPANVRLIDIAFEHQDLGTVLREHGFRRDQRTLFIWEAVTQYLTEPAVRRTFDVLAGAAPGSWLVFTYVRQDFIDGSNLYGAAPACQRFRVKRQIWHFGMVPERVSAFLAEYGWQEREQMGSEDFIARYMLPSDRTMPVSGLERVVYAEKLSDRHL